MKRISDQRGVFVGKYQIKLIRVSLTADRFVGNVPNAFGR